LGSQIQQNLESIRERIATAEKKVRRKAHSVSLIAVSKTKSAGAVNEAIEAGARSFGENYVQEALKKIEQVGFEKKIQWHFIGNLQSNKSKQVVGHFETIQSVDRLELALALNKAALEKAIHQKILVQIKLGGEITKGGILPEESPRFFEDLSKLKHLRIEGLMSLPPIGTDPSISRKYFSQLFEYREKWQRHISSECGTFTQLSMGTTHDFEVAIEEGATMVRVGTAIFGARE
jgi:pyridoxal phosphate enzyme (YggS family)